MAACGGDDDEPDLDPNPGQNPGTDEWVDEPDGPGGNPVSNEAESKEYLGETASIVMDRFRPEDQKPLVDIASSFANDYGDYDLDTSAFEEKPSRSRALNYFFAALRGAAAGSYMNLSRAANAVVEIAPYTGVYRPDATKRMFYRAAASSDVVVEFYHDGRPCTLVVSPSSDTWSVDAKVEADDYTVKVPRNIQFALTDGGVQLVSGSATTYWKDGVALQVEADVTAANIRVVSHIDASNSVVTTNDELYVDGTLLVRAEGSVNGSNMVSTKAIEGIFDRKTDTSDYWNGYEYVTVEDYYYEFNPAKAGKMFHDGRASIQLLNRVLVNAEVSDAAKLFNIGDLYFDTDSYDKGAKAACQKACDLLNKYALSYVFLAGNSNPTAMLTWQPYLDDESNWDGYRYEEWVPEGVIAFSDGSTYSVSQYFMNDFGNVLNRFESLYYAYERMFEAAF